MKDDLIQVVRLAKKLRVDANWLIEETNAGRIPSISTGRERLYSLSAVKAALAERAGQKQKGNHLTILAGEQQR